MGYIIRGPIGGMAWHHLQYVLGLAKLGHDVYFVEDSNDYPSCYDPSKNLTSTDPTYGLSFAKQTFNTIGLNDHWAYFDNYKHKWFGPCADQIVQKCEKADLLLNISGKNCLRSCVLKIPNRVLIDTDPVFTQITHLIDPAARRVSQQHTAFFSFGENIGQTKNTVPNDYFPWQPTRQPVVLDAWPTTPGQKNGNFTSIMQWESYPAMRYNGNYYGMKSDSFEPYIDLPKEVTSVFELALGSPNAPKGRLREKGWLIRDPLKITRDPWIYQRYIQKSKAEFGVAKHGYVVSRSGWFSERSVNYLASSRPVLVQETGFSDWLEADSGVVAFSNPNEAIAGIEEINENYDLHCKSARKIAEKYFDSRKVLPRLIKEAISTQT